MDGNWQKKRTSRSMDAYSVLGSGLFAGKCGDWKVRELIYTAEGANY